MKNEITVNLKIKDGEQLISKIEEAMEHLKKARDIIAWDLSKKIQVEMEPSTNKADDPDIAEQLADGLESVTYQKGASK